MTPSRRASAAHDMNVLARFLGMRDVPELTRTALDRLLGHGQADVMVLFGGSILAGGDVLAQAMRDDVARTYVIAGGAGHTTQTFRSRVRELAPDVTFADDAPEADVFAAYLEARHGLEPDLLERSSTNCGNNVTCLLDLLRERDVPCSSIIMAQDATMQRRMDATLRRFAPDVTPVSFATYEVSVVVGEGGLAVADPPLGMWDVDRYLELLMGEVPRLTDDAGGYGPNGKGYLAHVDVPAEVGEAFGRLLEARPDAVRRADAAYASVRGPAAT
ncbi:MAG: hypothetical protein PHR15_03130 [Atopobiaceae bacterium]|nr:hypothetical protein [Atopobiaceae bacterium]MCH4214636.1 hypothetical protein [Atopobiaceae bacterium]MCH4230157.1 hypothetical protein [Atopobiaceae bacterium]MCI1225867.1 hypothetical protein [Atopobiaceae bacterium]MDD3176794.1 hypothetical protein [Atopobiaceae bacterium]